MPYKIVSIPDLLELKGEEWTQKVIAGFSCAKNEEIEYFLKTDAVEFAKRKMSITYLVFDEAVNLAAYFTLTHKSAKIPSRILSNTQLKKLAAHAKLDDSKTYFDVSAFLIAQFGKNSNCKHTVSGAELMRYALAILRKAQRLVGGSITYLECEQEAKLLSFYQNEANGFYKYGERVSADGKNYCQLLKFL